MQGNTTEGSTAPMAPAIYQALAAVQANLPVVTKTARASYGAYADYDTIVNVVRPIINSYGLFLSQRTSTRIEGSIVLVGVETVITAPNGEYITSGPLYIPISPDGSVAQSCGSIITYAKRYSLCALLAIATGDDNDGDTTNQRQYGRRY